jgi:hypothetical protein
LCSFTRVKCHSKISGKTPAQKGVRLVDSLSPLLFKLIKNEIIIQMNRKKGCRMGKKEINIICYADDAVLIAEIRITYRDIKPVYY